MFKLAIEQGIFDVESYPNPVFYDYIVWNDGKFLYLCSSPILAQITIARYFISSQLYIVGWKKVES